MIDEPQPHDEERGEENAPIRQAAETGETRAHNEILAMLKDATPDDPAFQQPVLFFKPTPAQAEAMRKWAAGPEASEDIH